MDDKMLEKKLNRAALNSVYGLPADDKRYNHLRSDRSDIVVMSPTVIMAVHELEAFASSGCRPMIKKVNRQGRWVELLGGNNIYFKGETEGESVFKGLRANIISAEMFERYRAQWAILLTK